MTVPVLKKNTHAAQNNISFSLQHIKQLKIVKNAA